MKRRTAARSSIAILLACFVFVGCSSEQGPAAPENTSSGNESGASILKVGRANVWAAGDLYRTVVTPATFNPGTSPYDELYNIGPAGGTFKDGYVLISDARPGDSHYNGGRWHLNLLKSNVDPTKYANASSVADLDLNDFMGVSVYFECPLIPMNRRP